MELDLSKLGKKVWLVKVPNAVAAVWNPICQRAFNCAQVDEDTTDELGVLKISTRKVRDGDQEKDEVDMSIHVKGADDSNGSKVYKMHQVPPNSEVLALAVSYKAPEKETDEPTQPRVEGTFDKQYNLMPVLSGDVKGNFQVDQAYCQLSRERSHQALQKGRGVQAYTDSNTDAMNRKFQEKERLKKRAAEVKAKAVDTSKKTRKERPQLQEELFRLFERQPRWVFSQLVKETQQPQGFLKEVLAEIATKNKAGPYKDTYELKKDYRDVRAAAQEQQEQNAA